MTDATATRRRRHRVAAVVVGVAVALGGAELALRLTGAGLYGPRKSTYKMRTRPDPVNTWEFDPSTSTFECVWDRDPYGRLPPGARMTYQLDAAGLRGPLPPPGQGAAVLVMGDSFTFGEGVPYEQTFVARIERGLAADGAPSPTCVDAGIPGYGTRQEKTRLPGWLDEFKPRAVVLVFLLNDVIPDDEWPCPDDRPPITDAEFEAERSGPAVWRILRNVIERPRIDRAMEKWYESFYLGDRRDCWATARAGLVEMNAAAKAHGARFGIVLFPILHKLSENPLARVHETIGAACAEMGIPFLDLTPALAVEPDRALWVHPTDHHPDARAHELAAGAMTPFVESLLR